MEQQMCTCGANIGSLIKTFWANVDAKIDKVRVQDLKTTKSSAKKVLDDMEVVNICCRANILAAMRQNECKNIVKETKSQTKS